jgi:transcriptional regulator
MGRTDRSDLLQGTLDLLILRTLLLGPEHGWGISQRIQQMTTDVLRVNQGSLYPALHRLELRGDVRSGMLTTENNRRARVYRLTPAGRRRMQAEEKDWQHFVGAMRRILDGTS